MKFKQKEFFDQLTAFLAWFWIPLLPEKERSAALKTYSINIDTAAVFSYLTQLVLFFFLMVSGALSYQEQIFDQLYPTAVKTGDERVTIGFFMQGGLVTLISYLFTFRGFFSTLGFIDAAVRIITYAVLKEPIGSLFCALPIATYRFAKRFWDQWRENVEFGPITPDEIKTIPGKGSNEIIVLSARQKDWHPAITVRYNGIDFHPSEPVCVKHGNHMRYSYRLLRQDENEIIRRLIVFEVKE
jgi:hypothetical protein